MNDNHDHNHEPDPELVKAGDQKIANVIREVLDERWPGQAPHMILNWHFACTMIDSDGDQGFWAGAPQDAKSWEVLGMLHYAINHEGAHITRKVFDE